MSSSVALLRKGYANVLDRGVQLQQEFRILTARHGPAVLGPERFVSGKATKNGRVRVLLILSPHLPSKASSRPAFGKHTNKLTSQKAKTLKGKFYPAMSLGLFETSHKWSPPAFRS